MQRELTAVLDLLRSTRHRADEPLRVLCDLAVLDTQPEPRSSSVRTVQERSAPVVRW